MKDEDLAPFAIADGLLAKMAEQPAGLVTDSEREWMLDRARESLAWVLGITDDTAGHELHAAAVRGEVCEQYSDHLAVVTYRGRILYVLGRIALRGAVHPERN